MIMKVAGKEKKGKGYRVNGVTVIDTPDGFQINFNATSIPKGKQVELLKNYRNALVVQIEILNAELAMLEE